MPRAAAAGSSSFTTDDRGRERLRLEAFPGRWNPRRSLPPLLEPLPEAVAGALERAGWWTPGSGEACAGGLVVALDSIPLRSALAFAREMAAASPGGGGAGGARAGGAAPGEKERARTPSPPTPLSSPLSPPSSSSSSGESPPSGQGPARLGPSSFLFALPSTGASLLGLLFGLLEHQATLAGGPFAGLDALRHALDLLEDGRLERLVVASLTALDSAADREGMDSRAAAALCLERSPGEGAPRRPRLEIDCGVGETPDVLHGPEEGEIEQPGATALFLTAVNCEAFLEQAPSRPGEVWYFGARKLLSREKRWVTLEWVE